MTTTDPRARLDEIDPRSRLAAIKARADAATEGPWLTDGEPDTGYWVEDAAGRDLFTWDESDAGLIVTTDEDAEFIAASRTDVEDMHAALVAVLNRVAEAKKTVHGRLALADDIQEIITDPLGGDRG